MLLGIYYIVQNHQPFRGGCLRMMYHFSTVTLFWRAVCTSLPGHTTILSCVCLAIRCALPCTKFWQLNVTGIKIKWVVWDSVHLLVFWPSRTSVSLLPNHPGARLSILSWSQKMLLTATLNRSKLHWNFKQLPEHEHQIYLCAALPFTKSGCFWECRQWSFAKKHSQLFQRLVGLAQSQLAWMKVWAPGRLDSASYLHGDRKPTAGVATNGQRKENTGLLRETGPSAFGRR